MGYRFGAQLPAALPLVMEFCDKKAQADDETREYSLQVREGMGWGGNGTAVPPSAWAPQRQPPPGVQGGIDQPMKSSV